VLYCKLPGLNKTCLSDETENLPGIGTQTVISADLLLSSVVTVIFAVPGATAVTVVVRLVVASTVATEVLLDFHVMFLFSALSG